MIKWTTERPAPVGLFQNVHIFLCFVFFSFALKTCDLFFLFTLPQNKEQSCVNNFHVWFQIVFDTALRFLLIVQSLSPGDRLRERPVLMPSGPLTRPAPRSAQTAWDNPSKLQFDPCPPALLVKNPPAMQEARV